MKAGLFSFVHYISLLLSLFGRFLLLCAALVFSQKYVKIFPSSWDGPALSQGVGLAGQRARTGPFRLRVWDATVFIWIKHSS